MSCIFPKLNFGNLTSVCFVEFNPFKLLCLVLYLGFSNLIILLSGILLILLVIGAFLFSHLYFEFYFIQLSIYLFALMKR
jgi:hypothetical protein